MKRRPSRSPLAFAAAAALLVLSGLTASDSTATAEARSQDTDGLHVAEASTSRVAGTFAHSATTIRFDVAAPSAVRAEATITIGDRKFQAHKDIDAGTAWWSGGDAALRQDDRDAFTAFTYALNTAWIEPANAAKTAVPAHQDLTMRLALLLAEAPLHVKIGTQDVPRPAEKTGPRQLPEGTPVVDSCARDGIATTTPDTAERRRVLLACQESNEDGILYTGCNENAWLVHDWDTHCFLGESIYVGPASYDCMAKCGNGCFIITGYTYDCGDHDRCNRAHNSNLGGCSDEFWEADDDFLWSSNQC
ncbi:MAG TPA: hypothetical protein VNO31_25240 [Umezawaea sp.]|nr:hypothetical protein [Umezawaea sp.]